MTLFFVVVVSDCTGGERLQKKDWRKEAGCCNCVSRLVYERAYTQGQAAGCARTRTLTFTERDTECVCAEEMAREQQTPAEKKKSSRIVINITVCEGCSLRTARAL